MTRLMRSSFCEIVSGSVESVSSRKNAPPVSRAISFNSGSFIAVAPSSNCGLETANGSTVLGSFAIENR